MFSNYARLKLVPMWSATLCLGLTCYYGEALEASTLARLAHTTTHAESFAHPFIPVARHAPSFAFVGYAIDWGVDWVKGLTHWLKCALIGLAVTLTAIVAAGLLVGLKGPVLLPVLVTAVLAGISAGTLSYFFFRPGQGASQGQSQTETQRAPEISAPLPESAPPLAKDVLLRVRFFPDDKQNGNRAKHFVTILDYRGHLREPQLKTEVVEGKDADDWEKQLREKINSIKQNQSSANEREIEIVTEPYPGENILDRVRRLLKEVYPDAVIVESERARSSS